jgi:hypothetical protein
MSKLRILIGISTAAMFAITAAQADEYYRTKPTHHTAHATHGKKAAPCVPYGDADLAQMCAPQGH